MITPDQAKKLLNVCVRLELKDHAFGDMEVTWVAVNNEGLVTHEVATGYFAGRKTDGVSVSIPPLKYAKPWKLDGSDGSSTEGSGAQEIVTFDGKEGRELLACGSTVLSTRNDSTGPDSYQEGQTMPGLTMEGVREELTGRDLPARGEE